MKKIKPITNKLLVLVSGGRSSGMMARHIQTAKKYHHYEKLYVFCNTSQERPETIQFLRDMSERWDMPINVIEGVYSNDPGVGVSWRLTDFDNLRMDGSIFSEAIEHVNKLKWVGVPGPPVPYCSEYMKTRPSKRFAKYIFGDNNYVKAIGYRYEDMPKRITLHELKCDSKRIAPLLTDYPVPVGKRGVSEFFKAEGFDLGIPSRLGNCEICWKKSDSNLVQSIRYGTRFIPWHQKEEAQYGNRFFRGNKSIDDLVRMAQSSDQLEMFDQLGDGCVCTFD